MRRLVLAAALAAAVAAPASAHHSAAMFDRTRSVDLKGTVKAFQWTNPHSWIQVEAPGPDGKLEEWSVECGSPNTLAEDNARRFWERAGARTITVNALAAELGQDWSSPAGSKMIGIVFEEIISKLDEMSA